MDWKQPNLHQNQVVLVLYEDCLYLHLSHCVFSVQVLDRNAGKNIDIIFSTSWILEMSYISKSKAQTAERIFLPCDWKWMRVLSFYDSCYSTLHLFQQAWLQHFDGFGYFDSMELMAKHHLFFNKKVSQLIWRASDNTQYLLWFHLRYILHLLSSSTFLVSTSIASLLVPLVCVCEPLEKSWSISFGSGLVISSSVLHSKLLCWLRTNKLFCLEFNGEDGFDPFAFWSNSVRLLLGRLWGTSMASDFPFVSIFVFGTLLNSRVNRRNVFGC